MTLQPVIVGAGPAGIRAARTLANAGLRPILIDEADRGGGQIYRQPPPSLARSNKTLYGFEARKAGAVHQELASLQDCVDYRPDTMVWDCEKGALNLIRGLDHVRLPYERLILATGATDRVLPFAGWLTPGVYTLGAAQVALKFQACSVGSRTLFMGTGPLLYLVAYQYLKAGVDVAGVFDTTPFKVQAAAAISLATADLATFLKGFFYLTALRGRGVAIRHGVRPVACRGGERVTGLDWRIGDEYGHTSCDAIAYGLGLRPETQLADLAGCDFAFDHFDRAWLPQCDRTGRSSISNVYLAGDGCTARGADAAILAGERAALALLEDIGHQVDANRITTIERLLKRRDRFRRALDRSFPFPNDWAPALDGATTVCRCEGIDVATIRACLDPDPNRIKSRTRAGMGRCQGRICSAAIAELAADACRIDIDAVGRLRGQAPVKPLPFKTVAGRS